MEMLKKISASVAREKFGELLDEVALKEDEYIVEQEGKPPVAIISEGKYRSLKGGQKKDFDSLFQKIKKMREAAKDVDEEVIDRTIEEAVQESKRIELNEINAKT